MKQTKLLLLILMVALVLAACSTATPSSPTDEPAAAGETQPQAEELPGEPLPVEPVEPSDEVEEPAGEPEAEDATASTNCASAEANELGASIAADYAFTSPEQVMGWFCAGAEFEDILVALETSEQTGASTEEMLTMLAAGMTWEEIWQVVGLTGQ